MKYTCRECKWWYDNTDCNHAHFGDDDACERFCPLFGDAWDFRKETVKRPKMIFGVPHKELRRMADEYHCLAVNLLNDYEHINYKDVSSRKKIVLLYQAYLAEQHAHDCLYAIGFEKRCKQRCEEMMK